MLRDMFKKTYTKIDMKSRTEENKEKKEQTGEAPVIPAGLWRKCNKCGKPIYAEDVKQNFYICPKCGGYFRVHAYRRIEMTADAESFEEWDREMEVCNPLHFAGYEKKLASAREKTRLNEAVVTGTCTIGGFRAVIGVCDARFLMSSMGHNVGEKITRAVERATEAKLPVILFACSGGARMQEGIVSLMQMAKTAAALKRHHEAGQLFVSVLTDPTTGGVTASFAMLGDIILAEPGALIGFAGPRVIEQTIGQKLPEGFQRAEFLLEHGFVDRLVERKECREVLTRILKLHAGKESDPAACGVEKPTSLSSGKEPAHRGRTAALLKSAWDSVLLSRSSDRLVASDYIHALFEDFIELHGDRYFKDDGAVIGGIASFHGRPVTVIGQEKGKSTKENLHRNFGMPSPEGYRKALRLMKEAEAFHRPVICFVDTPGAFCGMEAEERGQGEAIARNLLELSALKVPVLSIVIGEGGSGGALAMAVANEVWMLENAIYSVLSPEGFASILWKDGKKAREAAGVMRITAWELYALGIIERVIPEDEPASKAALPALAEILEQAIEGFFETWGAVDGETASKKRYERFRKF
ncbi:MAG: acetyl-CoA carboxylase carboxyltransferase subunit beta [Lachnospiraceae bacterium]|nr:acetyl-CoA carboxylase carboxyltransferase subunit beta [Lachnospiraceae bacterium]